MSRLDDAKATLRHYLAHPPSVPLSGDAVREIDSIVDDIVAHVIDRINCDSPVPINTCSVCGASDDVCRSVGG